MKKCFSILLSVVLGLAIPVICYGQNKATTGDCLFYGNDNYQNVDEFATCDYRFTMLSTGDPTLYPSTKPFSFSPEIKFDALGEGTTIWGSVFKAGKGISVAQLKSYTDEQIRKSIRTHFGKNFKDSTLTDAFVLVDLEYPINAVDLWKFDHPDYQDQSPYKDYSMADIIYEFKRRYRITREVLPNAKIGFYSYINSRNGVYSDLKHSGFVALGMSGVFDYIDYISVNLYIHNDAQYFDGNIETPRWTRIDKFTRMFIEKAQELANTFSTANHPLALTALLHPFVIQTNPQVLVSKEVRQFQDAIIQQYPAIKMIHFFMGQNEASDSLTIEEFFKNYSLVPKVCFCNRTEIMGKEETELTDIKSLENFPEGTLIYPNPFNNTIHIDLTGNDFNQAIITDILGNKIVSFQLDNAANVIRIADYPEMLSIPNGMYFIVLTGPNEHTQTVKIIKS